MVRTRDMANRCVDIMIRKRPDGYPWRQFISRKDGKPRGLVAHVRAHRAYYRGCIESVLREWHRRGKPTYSGPRLHDFHEWAAAAIELAAMLDMSNPLADARDRQRQGGSPSLVFARAAALAIKGGKMLGRALTASAIYAICRDAGVEDVGTDDAQGHVVTGRLLGPAFTDAPVESRDGCELRRINVGGFEITRIDTLGDGDKVSKSYMFDDRSDPRPAVPSFVQGEMFNE
jgi:hypothetical protein